MELFRIKFPEMERFPQEEREPIMRRCIEGPEMQRLRKRWSRYAGIAPAAALAVVLVLANLVFKWNAVVTAVVAVLLAMFAIAARVFLNVSAEYWLIRRLLRKELEGRG